MTSFKSGDYSVKENIRLSASKNWTGNITGIVQYSYLNQVYRTGVISASTDSIIRSWETFNTIGVNVGISKIRQR